MGDGSVKCGEDQGRANHQQLKNPWICDVTIGNINHRDAPMFYNAPSGVNCSQHEIYAEHNGRKG